MQVYRYRNHLWRSPSVVRITISISTTRTRWAGASSACTARWRTAQATMTPATRAQPGVTPRESHESPQKPSFGVGRESCVPPVMPVL